MKAAQTFRLIALIALAGVGLGGCNKKASGQREEASLAQGPKRVEIVEPEGVNLSEVIEAHGLDEYEPYYSYGPDDNAISMRLYRHRFVELDGEAPAEVILSMADRDQLDMIEQTGGELPSYIGLMHHVYTFKDAPQGRYLGTFNDDIVNPYTPSSTRVDAIDLNGDGRQELLLRDEMAYYMPLRLFEYRLKEGQIRDVIWSEPVAESFIPFDHDQDGALEIVAFPGAEVYASTPLSWGRAEAAPKAPFVLAPDERGFWHVQPLRRPYEQWATELMMELLEGQQGGAGELSPETLWHIKAYNLHAQYTYPEEVYEALLKRYHSVADPFDRARFMAYMPARSPEVIAQLCEPLLASGAEPVEVQVGCLAALADAPSEANRDLILESYPNYIRAMREYPQLDEDFYSVSKFSNFQHDLTRVFREAGDLRLIDTALEVSVQGIDEQNFYERSNETYALVQWGWDEAMTPAHRRWLKHISDEFKQAISRNEAFKAKMLGDLLYNAVLSSLPMHREMIQIKARGEEIDEEAFKRGEESAAFANEELPATLFEPLIGSPEPRFRMLALDYFAMTDTERFGRLFRVRQAAEKDDLVVQALYSRVYALSGEKSLDAGFWKELILAALASPDAQRSYYAYNLIPMFMEQASVTQMAALWDETSTHADFQAQLVWPMTYGPHGERDLSHASWEPMRQRLVEFYKRSTNASQRSSVIYILQRFGGEEIKGLLRDTAKNEQELYLVQSALTALAELQDEQFIALLKLRAEELKAQPYIYYGVLQQAAAKQSEAIAPLLIEELDAQDPTKPLSNDLFWSLGAIAYGDERQMPEALRAWAERDLEEGLKITSTSCIRLGQQLMLLFLSGDQGWEKRLEQIEVHPECASSGSPYMARSLILETAAQLALRPKSQQDSELYAFIRQHHDFPYRPIRMTVTRFEESLEQAAKAKEEERRKAAAQGGAPPPP